MIESSDCFLIPDGGQDFFTKVHEQRIPIHGSINLTENCNLRCQHCYIENHAAHGTALNTTQWLTILDDITEAGCLFLLITGGEPLLRKDFTTIYRHAIQNGILTAVFTNGTTVTDTHCEAFTDLPPRYVEISIYAATEETYTTITGVPGTFSRVIAGLEKLLGAGIKVKLKTMLMTLNRHEFDDIKAIATRYNLEFRMDPLLFPRLNGDLSPLSFRVPAHEAISKESRDDNFVKALANQQDRVKGVAPSNKLYECGCGNKTFHIDADGTLRGCMLSDDIRYDLTTGTFEDGWRRELPKLRELTAPSDGKCRSCSLRFLCGICPPIARRETGNPTAACNYLCDLGQNRYDAIDLMK